MPSTAPPTRACRRSCGPSSRPSCTSASRRSSTSSLSCRTRSGTTRSRRVRAANDLVLGEMLSHCIKKRNLENELRKWCEHRGLSSPKWCVNRQRWLFRSKLFRSPAPHGRGNQNQHEHSTRATHLNLVCQERDAQDRLIHPPSSFWRNDSKKHFRRCGHPTARAPPQVDAAEPNDLQKGPAWQYVHC